MTTREEIQHTELTNDLVLMNIIVDQVLASFAGRVDRDETARSSLSTALFAFASNYSSERPKLLIESDRDLLIGGIASLRSHWEANGDDWISDIVINGYVGWSEIRDDEILFETLINNPIHSHLPGRCFTDTRFQFEKHCITLMNIMARKEVMDLPQIQEHLRLSEDNCFDYSLAMDYLHTCVMTTSEDVPSELKAEAKLLTNVFEDQLKSIREQFHESTGDEIAESSAHAL